MFDYRCLIPRGTTLVGGPGKNSVNPGRRGTDDQVGIFVTDRGKH